CPVMLLPSGGWTKRGALSAGDRTAIGSISSKKARAFCGTRACNLPQVPATCRGLGVRNSYNVRADGRSLFANFEGVVFHNPNLHPLQTIVDNCANQRVVLVNIDVRRSRPAPCHLNLRPIWHDTHNVEHEWRRSVYQRMWIDVRSIAWKRRAVVSAVEPVSTGD